MSNLEDVISKAAFSDDRPDEEPGQPMSVLDIFVWEEILQRKQVNFNLQHLQEIKLIQELDLSQMDCFFLVLIDISLLSFIIRKP